MTNPLFTDEGPEYYQRAFQHNRPFAVPSQTNYQTVLTPGMENQFRQWVRSSKAAFDVNAQIVDYDMRGYWLEMYTNGSLKPSAPPFYPDTYKTPYDTTFSQQSKYATSDNPFKWVDGATMIDTRDGSIVFFNPRHYESEKLPGAQVNPSANVNTDGEQGPTPGHNRGWPKWWRDIIDSPDDEVPWWEFPGGRPPEWRDPGTPLHQRSGAAPAGFDTTIRNDDSFANRGPGSHDRPYAPDRIPKLSKPKEPDDTSGGLLQGAFDAPRLRGAPGDLSQQPSPWYVTPVNPAPHTRVEEAGHFEAGFAEGRRIAPRVREQLLNAIDNHLVNTVVEGLRGHGII